MSEASTDPLVLALIALCRREGGHAKVGAEAEINGQTVYQIISGVKLASGNPRGVGPGVRKALDARFPGWRALASPKKEANQPQITTLQALSTIRATLDGTNGIYRSAAMRELIAWIEGKETTEGTAEVIDRLHESGKMLPNGNPASDERVERTMPITKNLKAGKQPK